MAPYSKNLSSEDNRIEQFGWLIKNARWGVLAMIATALLAGIITRTSQLYIMAGAMLLSLVGSILAQRSAAAGHLQRGVYWFIGATSVVLIVLPLFFSGLIPVVMVSYVITILLVGLYVSVSRIPQQMIIAVVLSAVAVALDIWRPLDPIDTGILGLGAALATLSLVGLTIYGFGSHLDNARQAAEDLNREMERSQAELQAHSQALEETTAALENRSRALEQLFQENERRADLLLASSQVTNTLARAQRLDQLLNQVTRAIGNHFGFYHVGIFLVDEIGLSAILRAANSPGGQKMLERGHQLGVGTTGVVGYVIGTGQPRLALDVTSDPTYYHNPDLPETRAEMAVPLRIGDQTIGALDIQSTDPAAFGNEQVEVLSALGDQIAVAIENTRLVEQSQTALEQAEATQKRFILQEWDTFLSKRSRP